MIPEGTTKKNTSTRGKTNYRQDGRYESMILVCILIFVLTVVIFNYSIVNSFKSSCIQVVEALVTAIFRYAVCCGMPLIHYFRNSTVLECKAARRSCGPPSTRASRAGLGFLKSGGSLHGGRYEGQPATNMGRLLVIYFNPNLSDFRFCLTPLRVAHLVSSVKAVYVIC